MLEILQLLAALVFAMVAGSVFGIWQGYDPTTYTAATFLEVHQGAVRGLNTLLPAMAFISILLTVSLAWFARGKGYPLALSRGHTADGSRWRGHSVLQPADQCFGYGVEDRHDAGWVGGTARCVVEMASGSNRSIDRGIGPAADRDSERSQRGKVIAIAC